ncbi:MAG: ChaN family lipoprotein, partial [Burkholderiaceae bacterium]
LAGCAAPRPDPISADALARAIARRPVVLLGEVHDNEMQHAVRAEALQRLLVEGARPAIAFEQFDRERQGDLDRARERPLARDASRVDHLIEQGGGSKSWNWNLYRPFLQLALDHNLPIVAANLSRAAAMRVSQQGFDAEMQAAHPLDRLPGAVVAAHERAVDRGHCGLMPPAMLPGLARAQIARDLTLAAAIRPHFERGVILLTGNGHVRNDIGVPFFLTAAERARTVTIGLVESGAGSGEATHFDVVMLTPAQPRADPCATLRKRYPPTTE